MTAHNGVADAPTLTTIPPETLRGILTEQKAAWETQRARLMVQMEVHMAIAKTLDVDKTAVIADLEAQLQQCVVALRVLDQKLSDVA
jgi:hypothetical protein